VRPLDQAFSDRIQPNIPGDRFNGFQRAKDVVVESLLPQNLPKTINILTSTPDFEALYEMEEVTRKFRSLSKEMEMIGH
jgi:hypothetical protein